MAPFLVVGAIFFLVMFGGVALLFGAIASDVGGDLGGPDPAWFWLPAVGGTALFVGVAVHLWRRANPRRDEALEARVDRHRARRGEELRVTVAGAPARVGIEVTLACRVHWDQRQRSGGYDSSSTSRVIAEATAWQQTTQASPSGEVALRLPADQPYSHEGEVISFAWLVSARTVVDDKPGRPSPPAAVWVDP
ncbi:MAG: hypothetical protein M3370_04060 [Actinomycetota bacterium]|nr:hypothetical protein [Actinomycetota bacterium]